MKTILMSSAIVLSVASLAVSAEETSTSFSWGNVTFQPRAYVGYANYTLESGDFTLIQTIPEPGTETRPLQFDLFNNSKINIKGPVGGLGATIAARQFFGDFYYQSTLNEKVYSGEERPLGSTAIVSYGDVNAQHSDWAISLGYRITDLWSVFAGYKSGKTDWDQSFQSNRLPPDSALLQDGNFTVKFDQEGPFLGTSYSFLLGPGALTVKAAYAYLNGEYTSDFVSTCRPPNTRCSDGPLSALQQFNWDGDSNAFSFGVSWTQSLADNLGVSLAANYHRYKFNPSGSKSFSSSLGDQIVESGQLEGGELTEELFTLTASLLYTF